MSDTIRKEIVEEARSWLGTKYHHHAHVKGAGVDCVWLLVEVYRKFGFVPADFHPGNYSNEWYMHKSDEIYMGGVEKFSTRLPDGAKPKPADVALYKVGHCVSHGAIVIDEHYAIHANRLAGKVEIAELFGVLATRFHSYWTVFP